MSTTDRERANEILKKRDRAAKGFKPEEGGDPLSSFETPTGDDDLPENKELRERALAKKGLKPKEGGDPLERADDTEEGVADRALPIGLGLKRSG